VKRTPPKNGVNENKKNALVIDGNALLKFGFHGAKDEYNHFGEHIGGLYQFLTILRKLLDSGIYHNVFVFWDGPLSGKLRYNVYKDYKSNRDKNFETGTYSQDVDLVRQKKLIWNYLEQLCIRQLEDPIVESDDFIGHFCINKSNLYNITICTIDRDMSQLISESIKIYFCDLKTIVSLDNYNEFFPHHQSNALLIKILAGDSGDCIKGVKGVKEPTLLKYFPVLTERETSLEEIINEAKIIQQSRIDNKKSPLQVIESIIGGITDGCQGKQLYEINKLIMDLKNPLLTKDAISNFNDITTLPLNPEGRSTKNVFKKIKENGLDRLISEQQFVNYILPFKRIMNKEKENYSKYSGIELIEE
jgi:5'-3' exonuclease